MPEPREPHQILEDEAGGVPHKAFLLSELQVAAETVYAEWEPFIDELSPAAQELVAMCWLIEKADIRIAQDGDLIVSIPEKTPEED